MALLLTVGGAGLDPAAAEGFETRTKAGSFEDVKFDLTNAIIERGLVIDHTGSVAAMLARTGAEVGSTKALYRSGEYMIFCSAKLSREMMEADPANIGLCPFVVFLYERADKPGEIIVGYRDPAARGSPASMAAITAVQKLLREIVADAVK
jgi:uncharacterized protein (DUF302 family)